jgi:hypothetical protein
MIGYVLLIILCAGFWTLFGIGIGKDKGWAAIVGIIFSMITTMLLLAASMHVICKPSDAESFRADVGYKQELLNSINGGMSVSTISKIIASAEFANSRIERNKKHCNSKMWGFLYNKGIAEVEPLVIPKIKYKITIDENASEE